MSDTHGLHERLPVLPDGDLLIHAGDLTADGTLGQVERALQWLADQPHRQKVVIAGNHDFAFEQYRWAAEGLVPTGMTYLQDSGVIVDGVRVWGSPWQPEYMNFAFNLRRGEALDTMWSRIPSDVELLVTHTPPLGILDRRIGLREHVGCEDLRRHLRRLTQLRLHVFGHIHEDYGTVTEDGRVFVNASSFTLQFEPNPPIVVDL